MATGGSGVWEGVQGPGPDELLEEGSDDIENVGDGTDSLGE